jgi:hypothetical protein
MISCKRVADLLLSDTVPAQSFWMRLQIRLHLAICDGCTRLARQLEQIAAAARKLVGNEQAPSDLEAKILRRLAGK